MSKMLGVLLGTVVAMGAHAEPFTYQGQLKENGQPANGAYDFVFQLMDAPFGGAIVGLAVSLEDVEVVDGLFQVELDFNTQFDGMDRWINVDVRDGASTGGYDTLLPRQSLTAVPEAQHAAVADTALNVPWAVAPGVIVYGDGNDRVLINRTNTISSAEYFGVYGDFPGFVGMYVAGPANSRPFYGYSVDNAISSYTYYDALTTEWRLVNNGIQQLTIDAQGDIVARNNVRADSFQFDSPKTRRVAVSGDVFRPWTSTVPYFSFRSGATGTYVTTGSSDWLLAPITLPDGARLIKMTAYCTDTAAGTLAIRLYARGHNSMTATTVFSSTTSGMNGSSLEVVDITPHAGLDVVDYSTFHYSLFVQGNNWPGDSSMVIGSVVIEYTIDEAN